MRASVRFLTVAAVAALFSGVLTVPVQAMPRPVPGSDVEQLDLAAAAPVRVVRGLNNPRQLTLLPSQGLLVAEAGRGGEAEVPSPFTPTTFAGPTGSVSWVPAPSLQSESLPIRIVEGLLSTADADGTYAMGPNGVGARSLAQIDIAMTYQSHELVEALPADLQAQAGTLLRSTFGGEPRVVADLAQWETDNDPDESNETGDTISNPFSVLVQRDRTLVADAGGNTVLSVNRRGEVSLFALLPDPVGAEPGEFDSDAVPTSLAELPDGIGYDGTIYRADGGEPLAAVYEYSQISGIAFGPDGSLYVSELFYGADPSDLAAPPGQLTKLTLSGERTSIPVPFPGGVAVDRWNNVYVAAWSLSPAEGRFLPDGSPVPDSDGQIWRLRL
jgi:hypothetical protein